MGHEPVRQAYSNGPVGHLALPDASRVNDLNPDKGIETRRLPPPRALLTRVNDLNPDKGIETPRVAPSGTLIAE